jgi:hypothetical protein
MKFKFALVGLAALGGLAAGGIASAMPVAPLSQPQRLRALLWSLARMAVYAQLPSTEGTATASVAMVMACVEATHTIAVIVAGEVEGPRSTLFPRKTRRREPAGSHLSAVILLPQ